MADTQKKKSGVLLYGSLAVVVVILFGLFRIFGPNTGTFTKGEFLYVHTGSDYEKLKESLISGGFVSDLFSFNLLAQLVKLPAHVRPGKYQVKKGMSNYNMLRMLRNGRQTPVKLVINRLRTQQDFINLLSSSLEADSMSLVQMLNNNVYLGQFGLDSNTIMCGIMPDTYDFFWNISADKALKKILKNYTRYWDATRKKEAQKWGLSPTQVVILASIVDEETNVNEDKPKIASVYLNRLDKGMKLEADPTVKFAIGDFTIKRITGTMLQTVSPYNTYANTGLPPGPICTPAVSSIEAVLQAPNTKYLYFCAKEDFSGYSNFASTYDDQMKNARAYQKALNDRGIH